MLFLVKEMVVVQMLTTFLFLILLACWAQSPEVENNAYRLKFLKSFRDNPNSSHYFGNVLVIVHSNYNCTIEQVQTYVKLWKPYYPNMAIFANWDFDDLTRLREHNLPVFHCPENDYGFLAQNVLLKALHKFQLPMFKGYLYIHDDLILSPKLVEKLDKNKFWIADYRSPQNEDTVNPLPYIAVKKISLEPWSRRNWGWPWFNHPKYGISAMEQIMTNHPEIEDTLKACTDLEKNEPGGAHTWYYASGDFYYLPSSYVHQFQHIMGIFSEYNLFFEIAVGTYMKCFSPAQDYKQVESIPLCTDWENNDIRGDVWQWASRCGTSTEALHPVKLSKEGNLNFTEQYLNNNKFFIKTSV